jgi:hypothetical protein
VADTTDRCPPLPSGRVGPRTRSPARVCLPRTAAVVRPRFAALLAGELRILLGGIRWWWLCGLALAVAAVAAPARAAIFPLLPLAWLWPVVAWSRLGTQQHEHDVHSLVDTAPARYRRLVAEWTAGLALTALAGIGPLLRLAAAADRGAIAAWCSAAAFIPTLALTLGVMSRNQRLFQAAYLMLWYAVVNRTSLVDFMGVSGDDGGWRSALVVAVAAAMGAWTLLVTQVRHAAR